MQIAPTIVMAASFAPIERFENRLLTFDIPRAHSLGATARKRSATTHDLRGVKLELKS
jgi:hypothetical protein